MLDLAADAFDHLQVGARDLDAHGALDAGGQHVDTVANGRHPDIGVARDVQGSVELRGQLLNGQARPPLIRRFELDRRFGHFQRCRIGGRLSAAGLAEHVFDFRELLDQAIRLLQQFGRLAGGQAGQRRGHVEQCALVERRHELAADAQRRVRCRGQHEDGDAQSQPWTLHDPGDDRSIGADQGSIQGVLRFVANAAADERDHQHRDQAHR